MTVVRALLFAGALAMLSPPDNLFAAAPHSGVVVQDGFELSDVALFGFAVIGIWFARRSMRARAQARRSLRAPPRPDDAAGDGES